MHLNEQKSCNLMPGPRSYFNRGHFVIIGKKSKKIKNERFFQSEKSREVNVAINQKTNGHGKKISQNSRDFSRDN